MTQQHPAQAGNKGDRMTQQDNKRRACEVCGGEMGPMSREAWERHGRAHTECDPVPDDMDFGYCDNDFSPESGLHDIQV